MTDLHADSTAPLPSDRISAPCHEENHPRHPLGSPARGEALLLSTGDDGPCERRWVTPLVLYLATFVSTFFAYRSFLWGSIQESLMYSGAVMFILTAHELGHFFQALRYRVSASLPYFIPMPVGPIGTMGAVIGMSGHMGNRKEVFDIGISGPLAGLVPALLISVIGLHWSTVGPIPLNIGEAKVLHFGDPLVMQFLVYLLKGPLPAGHDVMLHPLAYAGWFGVLLTSLNLFPIGQLDGGHILYALLRGRAYLVSEFVLLAAIAGVVWYEKWIWSVMLLLAVIMGPRHPPTVDDEMPLGRGRGVLGILTLLFIVVGFTPDPFMF